MVGTSGAEAQRFAHDREGLDVAVLHLRQRVGRLDAFKVDIARKQIAHRIRGTAVRHELKARAGLAGSRCRRDALALPLPMMPADALSGFACSHAMSSFTLSAGRLLRPMIQSGASVSSEIGSKSFSTSNCTENTATVDTWLAHCPMLIV
jgi:hypothetical protein